MHNNNNNKRRQNNMNGGNAGGGQQRHNNNRPRRFGSSNGGRHTGGGADETANIARTRRNATQSREKYQNMARDAMAMGDRVMAENYLQHADHYYRVLLALPPEEVRHHNQRGANNGQADNEQNAQSDTMQSDHADAGHNEPVQAEHLPHTGALPAFITQPVAQENIPE